MFIKYLQSFLLRMIFAVKKRYVHARKEDWVKGDWNFVIRLQKEEQELSVPTSVPQKWQEQVAALRSDFHKKFSRLVLWGEREMYTPYSFIQRGCYLTAKRLGIPAIWLEDYPKNVKWLFPGDLVMCKMRTPYTPDYDDTKNIRPQPDIFYCLDRTYSHTLIRDMDEKQYLLRQEYRNSLMHGLHGPKTVRLADQRECAYYNPEYRLLCQPYGTDLLPWEFLPPVFRPNSKEVNHLEFRAGYRVSTDRSLYAGFVGYLKTVGLRFKPFDKQTSAEYQELIRRSRLAPILGNSDLEENYPHCRMFKNISYGQLGYSNIPIHQKIYKDCHPPVGSLEEMSDYVLRMSEDDYVEMAREQQKVTQNYTFLQYLASLFKYF